MAHIATLFIFVYFVFIFLVLEISVTLLVITGLEVQVARLQVVSMLTSTGFTTKESELIARHPIRRKIAIFLILFGVFSLAVIIASISKILAENFSIVNLCIITGLFAIILIAIKHKVIHANLTLRFHEHLNDEYEIHELPIQEILYISEDDLFIGIQVNKTSHYVKKKLTEIISSGDDIQLLYVRRGEEKLRKGVAKLTIETGDILFLYGSKMEIEQKFKLELATMEKKDKDEQEIVAIK